MVSRFFGKAVFPLIWFVLMHFLFFLPGSSFGDAKLPVSIPFFDKIIHFGLFAVLMFSLAMYIHSQQKLTATQKNRWTVIVVFACILDGILVEFIQATPLIHRDFDWWDALADSLGVLAGWALARQAIRRPLLKQGP